MTVAYNSFGNRIVSAVNATTFSPRYPATLAATDVLLLFVFQKPTTANGGGCTTPTGWTLVGSAVGKGGYGTSIAADTGNTNLYVYRKDIVVPGDALTYFAITVADNDVSVGYTVRLTTGGATLSTAFSSGEDTTAGTPTSVTTGNLDVASGDVVVCAMGGPTDIGTGGATFSAETVSMTGITFGTPVEINELDTSIGLDAYHLLFYADATAGSANAALTMGATVAGTNTNMRGPGVAVCVRETVDATVQGYFGIPML